MTADAILQAVDLTETAANKIPSGSVVKTTLGSTRLFWALRSEDRFLVLLKLSIGPKGGVYGYVYLRDMAITPTIDSIRVSEVAYFGTNKLMPLHELFMRNEQKCIPDDETIMDFLEDRVTGLPSDIGFYENWFAHGYFDTPSYSIRGLQGGAPGLG